MSRGLRRQWDTRRAILHIDRALLVEADCRGLRRADDVKRCSPGVKRAFLEGATPASATRRAHLLHRDWPPSGCFVEEASCDQHTSQVSLRLHFAIRRVVGATSEHRSKKNKREDPHPRENAPGRTNHWQQPHGVFSWQRSFCVSALAKSEHTPWPASQRALSRCQGTCGFGRGGACARPASGGGA